MEEWALKEAVFTGSCTAMITPFHENGIDYARLKRQLEYQAENGTNAVVIAGTTGENATLKDREYEQLAVFCVRACAGRMKVILGIGGNCTEKCLENARFAAIAGADAVLMTPPYYNKTSETGLIEHFQYVADRADLPLILYNVPGRTVIGITESAYLTLAKHPNINGVKEASGDFSLIARVAAACDGDLWIWSGNDDNTIPMMALGAQGVISVASNIIPAQIAAMCEHCLNGRFDAANALYAQYAQLIRLLFIETNPIPVKAAMKLLGTDSGQLRRPLADLSAAHLESLKACMERTGLLG